MDWVFNSDNYSLVLKRLNKFKFIGPTKEEVTDGGEKKSMMKTLVI